MNLKDLFIPYELALLAKEKGFNEPCLAWWHYERDNEYILVPNDFHGTYSSKAVQNSRIAYVNASAPLYQQIVDWFRIKYAIDIVFVPPIAWQIQTYNKDMDKHTLMLPDGNTEGGYYTALNKAIEEAFKLIDDKTTKKSKGGIIRMLTKETTLKDILSK